MKAARVSFEDIRRVIAKYVFAFRRLINYFLSFNNVANQISGRSPVHRNMGVAGTTGVGSVVRSNSAKFAPGSTVFVIEEGTWNDIITVSENNAIVLPSKLSPEGAAQLDVVATAWAILQKTPLQSKDVILLDDTNEALNAAVISIAKSRSLQVAIRDTAGNLHFGGKTVDSVENVKLVITSATGEEFTKISRVASNNGTVVHINGKLDSLASGAAVYSSVSAFIFQNKAVKGFDFTGLAKQDSLFVAEAITAAANLLAEGKVSLPAAKVLPQSDFASAIATASSGKSAIINISK